VGAPGPPLERKLGERFRGRALYGGSGSRRDSVCVLGVEGRASLPSPLCSALSGSPVELFASSMARTALREGGVELAGAVSAVVVESAMCRPVYVCVCMRGKGPQREGERDIVSSAIQKCTLVQEDARGPTFQPPGEV
jgi:hypothetical protein